MLEVSKTFACAIKTFLMSETTRTAAIVAFITFCVVVLHQNPQTHTSIMFVVSLMLIVFLAITLIGYCTARYYGEPFDMSAMQITRFTALFVALGCAVVCFASIVPKINDADKTNAQHESTLNTNR